MEVTGTPPFTYDWAFNGSFLSDGGNVTGANTASLTITGVKPEQAGQYEVLVSDQLRFAQSEAAILTVQQGLETSIRLSIALAPQPRIEWLSKAGASYRVQFTTDLSSPNWAFLGDPVLGTGGAMSVTDITAAGSQRFYRLLQTQP